MQPQKTAATFAVASVPSAGRFMTAMFQPGTHPDVESLSAFAEQALRGILHEFPEHVDHRHQQADGRTRVFGVLGDPGADEEDDEITVDVGGPPARVDLHGRQYGAA